MLRNVEQASCHRLWISRKPRLQAEQVQLPPPERTTVVSRHELDRNTNTERVERQRTVR
jgi:hypothetical protein